MRVRKKHLSGKAISTIGIHSLRQVNPDPKSPKKLNHDNKLLVCNLLARGYTPSLVCQIIKEEKGIELTSNGVYDNYLRNPKWIQVITSMRREMNASVASHPLANKAIRLSYIQDGLQEALRERVIKINHDKDTGRELSRIVAKQPGIVASLIKEARAEVEGDQPIAVFNQTIDNSKKTLINLLHGNARDVKNQTPKKYKEGSYDGTMLRVT